MIRGMCYRLASVGTTEPMENCGAQKDKGLHEVNHASP